MLETSLDRSPAPRVDRTLGESRPNEVSNAMGEPAVVLLILAIIATIAGILALAYATTIPSWFTVIFLALSGVVGLVGVSKQVRKIVDASRIRRQLANAQQTGRRLYSWIDDHWARDAAIPVIAWENEVEGILREWKGDDSYVERFRGGPNDVHISLEDFPEDNPASIDLYINKRISQTKREVPDMDVSKFTSDVSESLRISQKDLLHATLRAFLIRRMAKLDDFILELKD